MELTPPTEEDAASYQARILRALEERGMKAHITLPVLRRLYPLCDRADWRITVSLAYDGAVWQVVEAEAGDTQAAHYGLAADLGSTSVVLQLIDCNTGAVLAQESAYNRQIAFGEDILNRIFYSKDQPEHLEELRRAAVDTILEVMERLSAGSGIDAQNCISMVLAGNTTMTHFLLGLDAFCVFSSPYSVRADQPGFFAGSSLGIPVKGYVLCCPGKANYLGGDIISGVIASGLYQREEISVFFDVGTNGELVVGNRHFLLCGAGAAGPALEGGVVKTGMRAAAGAVEHVDIRGGRICCTTIGGEPPRGICGSGIVDLLSELFLCGWVDLRGRLQPEASDQIAWHKSWEEYAVCYAPGLWFGQSDIREFLRTKAAAYTMMEYMLSQAGMSLDDVDRFYMAGAFGTHIRKESAVNIGMYPDVEPERIFTAGNTSLEGARRLLTDACLLDDLEEILGIMSYVQFGAVEDFVERMTAASALPHTDLERYPSVRERLRRRRENQ